jgi:hypothetical protein
VNSIAIAFGVIGWPFTLSGRQLERAWRESRYRVILPHPENRSRTAKLAPRRERRRRYPGAEFLPVYGHAISAPGHKEVISAMKYAWLHKDDES